MKCSVLIFALFLLQQSANAASWNTNAAMITARDEHTATLLPNGQVLVAGGFYKFSISIADAELYDPATGSWTPTGPMATARGGHTATLLPTGKVLVTGGLYISADGLTYSALTNAELYDPATGNWTATAPLAVSRYLATATLLPHGKVLVAGGETNADGFLDFSATAEIYDPATASWTMTGPMIFSCAEHTATVLPNGQVLVVGQDAAYNYVSGAQRYDPMANTWTTNAAPQDPRAAHIATLLPNGKVLVAGGRAYLPSDAALSSAELFDPVTGAWTNTASMMVRRVAATAALLPNGQVLIVDGNDSGASITNDTPEAELYDPATGSWTLAATPAVDRFFPTATVLPTGQVLLAGGYDTNTDAISTTESYDPSINPPTGAWTNTGPLLTAREYHTATLLPDGTVMVVGGFDGNDNPLPNTDLYNPNTKLCAAVSPLNIPRFSHATVLLPNGKALAIGGFANIASQTATAELYDSIARKWTMTGSLKTARSDFAATLLPNGKVLVAGGYNSTNAHLASAEIYDPNTGFWTLTGSLLTGRQAQAAVLLPNGKVLIAGGYSNGVFLASSELYDPATGKWTATGDLHTGRDLHSMILLPNGKVLVFAGENGTAITNAELYDPQSGLWQPTGSMNFGRFFHAAMLLPNGKVLAAAGLNHSFDILANAELYDPATGTWSLTGDLPASVEYLTMTLLTNGEVFVAGGNTFVSPGTLGVLTNTALYDIGAGFSNSWQPQITAAASPLNLGNTLSLSGMQFLGISSGSTGGTQDSPANFPVVQLRSLANGQTLNLPSPNWFGTAYTSLPINHFPPGNALVTAFVNGIPSPSQVINLNAPVPLPVSLSNETDLTDGTFQFSFTNNIGALFGVFATTNLTVPAANWTALGAAIELAPGHFQFTDLDATNHPRRFYRLRAP